MIYTTRAVKWVRRIIMSTHWKPKTGITLSGMLVVLIAGCATPEVSVGDPDLVPVPAGPFGGSDAYCYFSNGPDLRIGIQNQGQGDAPPTSTRVVFSPGGTIEIPTPPVRAGQRAILGPVTIPLTCFDSDCDFKVTADSKSQADEASGEENNSADGRCRRP